MAMPKPKPKKATLIERSKAVTVDPKSLVGKRVKLTHLKTPNAKLPIGAEGTVLGADFITLPYLRWGFWPQSKTYLSYYVRFENGVSHSIISPDEFIILDEDTAH